MGTFLFDNIIFGPVSSRRLGKSLGINLLPNNQKICNFNCVYCECGWTEKTTFGKEKFHPRENVSKTLVSRLEQLKRSKNEPDVITFAGNGEPTMHPAFEEIINDTIQIRDKIIPGGQIAVLSNATLLHKPSVFRALEKVNQNILKIDSAFPETIEKINQPKGKFDLKEIVHRMKAYKRNLIIQTLFLRGEIDGIEINNTSNKEIEAWLELLKEIKPSKVMIYTFHRETSSKGLIRIPEKELQHIADKVEDIGINTLVSP